jgi:hypothetical protein
MTQIINQKTCVWSCALRASSLLLHNTLRPCIITPQPRRGGGRRTPVENKILPLALPTPTPCTATTNQCQVFMNLVPPTSTQLDKQQTSPTKTTLLLLPPPNLKCLQTFFHPFLCSLTSTANVLCSLPEQQHR